jgi:hypothetical protein
VAAARTKKARILLALTRTRESAEIADLFGRA